MKNFTACLLLLLTLSFAKAQNLSAEYYTLIKKAEALYDAKNYRASAFAYSKAFKISKGRAKSNDRYNAACLWALANYPDSAFSNLQMLVVKEEYSNYKHITTDADLQSLHGDKRWPLLLAVIKKNQTKAEANYNKALVSELDSVYNDDQLYRRKIAGVAKKFGRDSKELKSLWDTIGDKDSVNLMKITGILDRYGWLGPKIVGNTGSLTLFLVIQHADQQTQEKYLPMMRAAVKKGDAQSANLALLEDRVAMEEGHRQIYGSQIAQDQKTGKYYINPIEDEPNVNKRRAAVGLEPLEIYAKLWDIDYHLPKRKIRTNK